MNYIVNLPQGTEITLGLPYGSATYTHGQIVPESFVTKSFPQYFSALPEPELKINTPVAVDDIIAKIKANIAKESTLQDTLDELKSKKFPKEQTKETPTNKAGRPKKTGFSKG